MENQEEIQVSETNVKIDNEIRNYLTETVKWGKFLAIMGYIGTGFLILAGLVMLVAGTAFSKLTENVFPAGVLGLVYIAIGVAYFFPARYLYNFSAKTKEGLLTDNQEAMTAGFSNLKSIFKFMGILTIVILGLYALILVGAIIAGIIAAINM